MAYTSDESGKGEIYVRPFPDVNKGKWQVSSGGGTARYGHRMAESCFIAASDQPQMAVAVETEPTFKRGNPKILFQGTYFST